MNWRPHLTQPQIHGVSKWSGWRLRTSDFLCSCRGLWLLKLRLAEKLRLRWVPKLGDVQEYSTMHYCRIPSHTQTMIVLIKGIYWVFLQAIKVYFVKTSEQRYYISLWSGSATKLRHSYLHFKGRLLGKLSSLYIQLLYLSRHFKRYMSVAMVLLLEKTLYMYIPCKTIFSGYWLTFQQDSFGPIFIHY